MLFSRVQTIQRLFFGLSPLCVLKYDTPHFGVRFGPRPYPYFFRNKCYFIIIYTNKSLTQISKYMFLQTVVGVCGIY